MENLKKFLLSTMLLLVCGIAGAQKIEVSGTVTDSNGETVIGATVMEKGTANGTVTDIDGNFKFQTNAGATVVVSYVGYNIYREASNVPLFQNFKLIMMNSICQRMGQRLQNHWLR